MHSARVSIGKISLTVRYAELAPAEAKKNVTAPIAVSVTAVSEPSDSPMIASSTPDSRYVAVIIRTLPQVSNNRLSSTAPKKLLSANAAMYQPTGFTPKKVERVAEGEARSPRRTRRG
jgi:hypothetical protein